MKKNRLTKQILLALAMSAVIPAGQAWAEEWSNPDEYSISDDGTTLTVNTSNTVSTDSTFGGKRLDDFTAININYSPSGSAGSHRALGIYSAEYDLRNTDITVNVFKGDGTTNNDGLHLTNHYPAFTVRSYTANIEAGNSDALNLSSDITTNGYITIGNSEEQPGNAGNGDLTLVVQDGSGIRANASNRGEELVNSITINGITNISIYGNYGQGLAPYQAAAFAGNDSYGSKGRGQIYFNGDVNIKLYGLQNHGIWSGKNGYIEVNNDMNITASGENSGWVYGIVADNGNIKIADETTSANKWGSKIVLNGDTNIINLQVDKLFNPNNYAISAVGTNDGDNGEKVSNAVVSGEQGIGTLWAKGDIRAADSGEINLEMNKVMDDNSDTSFYLDGAVVAVNEGNVLLKSTAGNNVISSSSKVFKLGVSYVGSDLTFYEGPEIVSALYSDAGVIELSGGSNFISSNYEDIGQANHERTIWAQNGGAIKITGQTFIQASNAESSEGNSKGIAVVAGTENWGSGEPDDDWADEQRSHVNVMYDGASAITGDIVAGYGGAVNISKNSVSTMSDGEGSETHSLALNGNALAGNGGILNLDFGNGGYWEGRADDYQDADLKENVTFYDPQFSNTVEASGTVDINLGTGSYWNVTGQSWATSLSGNNSTIDLQGNETGGYALHVRELNGNNHFILNLNNDVHSTSDMLYIADTAESSGVQTIEFTNITGWENMTDGDTLRFATVNADTSELSFESSDGTNLIYLQDQGIKNMAFAINNEGVDYSDDKKEENESYNGTEFGETKPGNGLIFENYNEENSLNWFLTKDSRADTISDAGKTVIAMSKVNYANAVYMDRLNKRMGEARYIDGDDGLWVRMRHDRIGKDDAFRSMNTMFELGYDWHAKGQKDGEHRQGVAFDYMRGMADYQNVAGDGDVRRAGVWLYDTWLGDKGHYSDYVVKYGRLSNDFDIYALSTPGEKISGDYDNDVWSVSAEYGRKKDIGNEWYFEPQVQAQYAYVTSADYTTSQGTKVELDGIDSLIGRAGFRLGRDTSEGNTVYFKADILHEFLGDQSIRAMDATGTLSTTYENEGTWYDVGFGFSHKMGEDSYLFLDVEHSFGNDNEDTYQVNIGLNRAF